MTSSFILPPSSLANPFPGLRPFRSDEHHLFFGREDQTAALLQLLRQQRFLAVVGTSGSGKSSLVRAGMIAELYGGTMTQAGSTWEVIILRPGGSPIENLARAMVEADLYDADDANTLPRLRATLSRSRFGLVEAVKQSDVFESSTNLLVVVDQFEELFRFRQHGVESEEAATSFVNLLLTASEQAERPIYVTITMRSDYLGDCSEIPGLAEAVNEGEYLIPRLLRDQKRDAIEKPIGVGGAKISPLLVQRLLNDVGDDPDQLPVLQHALMRMWDVWSAGRDHSRPIDFCDFEATGGLAAALSNHADEIYDGLPNDAHRQACERIFKTLTVKGEDNRGIRRPTRLSHIQAIAGADRATIIEVLDAYRQAGVTFVMPGLDVELTNRTVLDLSHESLMRGWQRLRTWVEEEAQSARIFRRMLDTARLWSEGKAGLFRDPDLQIALSWREQQQPNAEWAEQYGGQIESAIRFLDASNAAEESELQAREAARQRELEQARQLAEAQRQRLEQQQLAARKLRKLIGGLAVVALIAGIACAVALIANNKANKLAKLASQEADNARQSASKAETFQRKTAAALTEVAAEKTRAEMNLEKAKAAEKLSREFRYATDMQLAATLVADSTANAGQVLARLSDHDPEQNANLAGKNDLRGFEWYYLKLLAGGRASAIKGFDRDVVVAAVSLEGELVTLSSDARLQRWNPVTRQETRPALDLKKGRAIGALTLSRDGRQAALAVGNQVSLVDAVTGQEQPRTIPANTRGGLIFSPDGRMIITVDTGVGWWDAGTGRPIAIQEFNLSVSAPENVSVSADGLTVAVGGQGPYRGVFHVFHMNQQTRVVTTLATAGDNGTKRALAISPDGKTVAVSLYFQGAIGLYDAATGKLLHREDAAHSSSISAIVFSPDGTELATGSLDGTIKVWKDFMTLDVAKATSLMGHSDQVVALAYALGERRLLSAAKDKSVRMWDLAQSASSLHRTIAGPERSRARYSPDGSLIAMSGERGLQLRDGVTGQLLLNLPERSDGLRSDSVAISPDGRLLAAGFGGRKDVSFIELWDIERRERLAELPGTTAISGFTTTEFTGFVGTLAFSADGKHLVAGFGSHGLLGWGDRGKFPLLVYDVGARRVVRQLDGHGNTCVSVAFSTDGSRLASASHDGTARIWDTATWKELHVLFNPDTATELGKRRVYDVAFSPDGKLLAMASAEGHVIIWDANTGEHQQTLQGHANEVWSVAFSPNGLTLASGSIDNTVRLWNVATWRDLVRLEPKIQFDPRSLSFSPDGNRLLGSGFSGNTVIWSVQPTDDQSAPKPKQLAKWLESEVEFQTRIQMDSEMPQLIESLQQLAQQSADNASVQAALAATRANLHASRQEWKPAVEQFDRLKQLSPTAQDAWLRTPGLLRLATALLHEDRPVEAAALLTSGGKRSADDSDGTRSESFGFSYAPLQYPLQLTRVYRGSSAWKAGLRVGDRLLKFNDLELTAERYLDFQKLVSGEPVTKLVVTVQHPNQQKTETVEIIKSRYIRDDVIVEQIEAMSAVVNQKLAERPNHPGLLELRAEIAKKSFEFDKPVADYTAAITALQSQDPPPTNDLQRLYCRRGDAYFRLKQWPLALADFAKGMTAESSDEDLLVKQARAQAKSAADFAAVVPTSEWEGTQWLYTIDKPAENWIQPSFKDDDWRRGDGPFGTEDYTLSRTRWSTRDIWLRHDFELPEWAQAQVQEKSLHLRILVDDVAEVYLNGKLLYQREGTTNEKYIAVELAPDLVGLLVSGRNLLAVHCFNLTPIAYIDAGLYVTTTNSDRDKLLKWFALNTEHDPWQRLAATYLVQDDRQAIDRLVERRPQSAGAIGDLFTQGVDKDWRRAVEIYSKVITPETTDPELLGRRARAYEGLKDWNAAAADWVRAAGDKPERMKYLAEFANRLDNAEQPELAAAERQRARQVLEATLLADPQDGPATESIAQVLLDTSEPKERTWSALKPAKSTTERGAPVALQEDHSILIEAGRETVTLPATSPRLSAIRIETSLKGAAPADGDTAFTEYRIVSTRLTAKGLRGRYVRIDLPGDNRQFPRLDIDGESKFLNLAELQVFQGERNLAVGKTARQSGLYSDLLGDWVAARAVDGNTDGSPEARSIAHTSDHQNPWWEVDLGNEQLVDRVVVWNRTEYFERLNHFRVRVLDAARVVLYEEVIDSAPNSSREIKLNEVQLARLNADVAGDESPWQVSFDRQQGSRLWKRFRISGSEDLPALTADMDSSIPKWSVFEASKLTLADGTKLAPQADGSFVVATRESDSLDLPVLPESVKALRVETVARTSSNPNPNPKKNSEFHEYRIQAIGAATSESSTIQGRYVRIDLPGDSSQYLRYPDDKDKKTINLAELQIFHGDENIALRKRCRLSSDLGNMQLAELAVDGNTAGEQAQIAHSQFENAPWWEVDLGGEQSIDRIVVWNRNHRELYKRMNHFRIRVFDRTRKVVFEQVIDKAPNRSTEISCRNLFVESTASTGDGKPSRNWSLRLGKESGIDLGMRFRISTTEEMFSLEQEEAIAEARNVSQPDARLAAAYDLIGQSTASADWFARALDSAKSDVSRQTVHAALQRHPRALTELLKRRRNDIDLQLAFARNSVDEGQMKLSRAKPDQALTHFQQASAIFARLQTQYPEPKWTVLQPSDLKSEGGATLTLKPDGSILASGENPDEDTYTISMAATPDRLTAFRLEALPDPSLPKQGPGRCEGNSNFQLSEIRIHAGESSVPLTKIVVNHSETEGYRHIIDGNMDPANYWSNFPRVGQANTAVMAVGANFKSGGPLKFDLFNSRAAAKKHGLGCFRISASSEPTAFEASRLRNALKPGELAALDFAIGQAFAQQDQNAEAAAAFARALDRVEDKEGRRKLIEQFQEHLAALTLLAEQRPQDLPLQLALAKRLAASGKKSLEEKRQDEALPHLGQAQELFSRLAAQHTDLAWTVVQPTEMTSKGGAELVQEADGSIFVSGKDIERDTYTLTVPLNSRAVRGIRLEVLPDARLSNRGSSRSASGASFLLTEFKVEMQSAGLAAPLLLTIHDGFTDYAYNDSSIVHAFDANDTTFWSVHLKQTEPHTAVFSVDPPQDEKGSESLLKIQMDFGSSENPNRNLGRFRLSLTSDANAVTSARFHHELKASGLTELERSLGNAHGRQGRVEQSAAAFYQALNLTTERDEGIKILQEASVHSGVLDKLAELRPNDANFLDVLARYYQQSGDNRTARVVAAKSRTLYEQQLAAGLAQFRLTKELADLLLDVSPVELATRNWTILKPTDMKSQGGATLTLLPDGSILAKGPAAINEVYTITTKSSLPNIQAFRLEAIPHESLPFGSSGRRSTDGNFALSEFKIGQSSDSRSGAFAAVPLKLAICDYAPSYSPIMNVLDGKESTFWDILPHIRQPHYAVFSSAAPLTTPADGVLTFTLEFKRGQPLAMGRFRLSASDSPQAFALENTRLLALKVENPWLRLGAAYQSLGEIDKASDAFARAFELTPNDQAKASAAQQAAAFDELFARLLERFPSDKSLRLGEAKYLAPKRIADGHYSEAAALLTTVLEAFPKDIELLTLRAQAFEKLRQWQAAIADYSQIIELETDRARRSRAEVARAEVMPRLGQFKECADLFVEEMLLSPGDYHRVRCACIALLLAGNPEMQRVAVGRFYEKFNATREGGQAHWLVRAFTAQPGLINPNNRQKLLDAAQTASGVWTEPMIAAIHYRLGDLQQAEPLLRTAKGKPQFEALAAMLLYDQGKTEEARALLRGGPGKWFDSERAKDPSSVIPAQRPWLEWSVELTVWREAARKLAGPRLAELDKLLAKEPDKTLELLERARMLTDAGLSDDALRDVEHALQLKVDASQVQGLRGAILASLLRSEEALPHLNQAVAAGSKEARVFAARGSILLKQGETASAQADLERSFELEPSEPAAQALADLLLAVGSQSWKVLKPTEMKSAGGATLSLLPDHSILASGKNPLGDAYTVVAETETKNLRVIRLEALPHESLPESGPGRDEQLDRGNFAMTKWEVFSVDAGAKAVPIILSQAAADTQRSMSVKSWNGAESGRLRPYSAVYLTDQPIEFSPPARLQFRMQFSNDVQYPLQNLGRFRLSVSDDPAVFESEKKRFAAAKITDSWAKLGAAFALSDRPNNAAKLIAQALPQIPNATARITLIEQAARNSEIIATLVKLRPDEPQLQVGYAKLLASMGRWSEAAAAYERAIELDSRAIPSWFQTGFWTVGLYPYGLEQAYPPESNPDPLQPVATAPGQPPASVRHWQPVTPDGNGRINFGNERGCNYVLTRVWSSSEQEFAFQMGDDDRLRLFLNHRLLFQTVANGGSAQPKEHELAVTLQAGWNTVLLKVENGSGVSNAILNLSRDPPDLVAARVGSRLYQPQQLLDAGKPDEAVPLLNKLIDEFPGNVRLISKRAEAYKKLQQLEPAEADCLRAVELDPGNADRWFALGDVYQSQQKWEPAIAAYSKHLELNKTNGFALVRRATCYRNLRRTEDSLADYDRAIAARTDTWKQRWQVERANLQIQLGHWQPAALDLQQAFDAGVDVSKNANYARELAIIQLVAGNTEGYHAAVVELLNRSGNDLNSAQASMLVQVFTAAPGQINETNRERLLAAAQKAGGSWTAPMTAAIHFRLGDLQQAQPLLTRSAGKPQYLYLAALLLTEQGQPEKARDYLKQADDWLQKERAKDPTQSIPATQSWTNWAVYLACQREATTQLTGK